MLLIQVEVSIPSNLHTGTYALKTGASTRTSALKTIDDHTIEDLLTQLDIDDIGDSVDDVVAALASCFS